MLSGNAGDLFWEHLFARWLSRAYRQPPNPRPLASHVTCGLTAAGSASERYLILERSPRRQKMETLVEGFRLSFGCCSLYVKEMPAILLSGLWVIGKVMPFIVIGFFFVFLFNRDTWSWTCSAIIMNAVTSFEWPRVLVLYSKDRPDIVIETRLYWATEPNQTRYLNEQYWPLSRGNTTTFVYLLERLRIALHVSRTGFRDTSGQVNVKVTRTSCRPGGPGTLIRGWYARRRDLAPWPNDK